MQLGKTKLPSRVSKAIWLFERAVREHELAKINFGSGHYLDNATKMLGEANKNLRVVLHQALGNKL